jgi:hypothetical protein
VAVAVAGADAHQDGARVHGVQEGVEAVARAVVRHLQHVRGETGAGGEQVGLGRELDVAGEQDGARGRSGAQHD